MTTMKRAESALPLAGRTRAYGMERVRYIEPARIFVQVRTRLMDELRAHMHTDIVRPKVADALRDFEALLERNEPTDYARTLRDMQYAINAWLRRKKFNKRSFLLARAGRNYQIWEVEWY